MVVLWWGCGVIGESESPILYLEDKLRGAVSIMGGFCVIFGKSLFLIMVMLLKILVPLFTIDAITFKRSSWFFEIKATFKGKIKVKLFNDINDTFLRSRRLFVISV